MGGTSDQRQREPELHLWLTVPFFTGVEERKSVADFLAEMEVCAKVSGASEAYVLQQVLPLALQGARRWWVLKTPFPSLEDFTRRFREEFLPPAYESWVQHELE